MSADTAVWARVGYANHGLGAYAATVHRVTIAGEDYFGTACGMRYPAHAVEDRHWPDVECKRCQRAAP